MIDYHGYSGVFDYDVELDTFTGHVVDLRDEIYFEGRSVDELRDSMQTAVDHYLAVCEARGEEPARPYSGQLRIRMESELHHRAAVTAAAAGVSLNSFVVGALERAVNGLSE